MVLPTDIIIKEEFEICEDELKSSAEYEVEVKVELESSLSDWCIKNDVEDFRASENSDDCTDVIDFESLSEYCIQHCTVCGDVFMDRFTLLQHNLDHLELKVTPITRQKYQCNNCFQYFKNKSILEKHILEENDLNNEPTQDLLISRTVFRGQEIEVDRSVSKTKTMHDCTLCGKALHGYKNWHGHITTVHGNSLYLCMKCPAAFKCSRYLKRHNLYVHNRHKSAPFFQEVQCTLCSAVLAHKHALKTHMRNCHCEKVSCELCGTVLKKSYMGSHMRRVHYDDGNQYGCCYCKKQFKSPGYLRVHIKNVHVKKKVEIC